MNRLYKSRQDRMIDGVCGGLAEYFGVDATLVRLAWVLLTLVGGSGILLYIAAMIIMPVNPAPGPAKPSSLANQRFWGFLLIGAGAIWLAANFGFSVWHSWWGWSWDVILPVILILAGVGFIFGGRNYVSAPAQTGEPEERTGGVPHAESAEAFRRLFRSRAERKLFGVCGGLGVYFGIDPAIVRILFVVSAFASFGITIVLYILMAIVVPEEPALRSSPPIGDTP